MSAEPKTEPTAAKRRQRHQYVVLVRDKQSTAAITATICCSRRSGLCRSFETPILMAANGEVPGGPEFARCWDRLEKLARLVEQRRLRWMGKGSRS